jgi:hypothetical protein
MSECTHSWVCVRVCGSVSQMQIRERGYAGNLPTIVVTNVDNRQAFHD